ncbi:hypothetical protein E4T44_01006 [Aureobasidium sp. EXF-8845]|nr:hypothetical protein E4T44_01006 [Aureobasidium sp. EXF-8845]KAI4857519.1 hypothetical protein E4T45_00984 [Aureobasidium sp. EXF-8846]
MPSNKDRLYLALYARAGAAKMVGKEDTYHWELLVGPKSDRTEDEGVRYHARERMKQDGNSEWEFEEAPTTMLPARMIMVRILIAKIESREKLAEILKQIPIRQGQQGWNCVGWIKEALSKLQESTNVTGRSVLEWGVVRNAAMSYCQKKKDQHRFDGEGKFDTTRVATFDLIQGGETVP